MKDLLLSITALVTLASVSLNLWQSRTTKKNKELSKKLRRALGDVLALYRCEEVACEKFCVFLEGRTPLAAKKIIRAAVRARGYDSPSEHCTPQRIQQELSELE